MFCSAVLLTVLIRKKSVLTDFFFLNIFIMEPVDTEGCLYYYGENMLLMFS